MLPKLKTLLRFIPKTSHLSTGTCFNVSDGQVTATDLELSMSMLIPQLKGFSFNVPASRFVDAVNACNGNPSLTVNENGTLTVKSSGFKVTLQLVPDDFPSITVDGESTTWGAPIIPALKALQPFMATTDKKPVLCSVCLKDGMLLASDGASAAMLPSPLVEGTPILLPSRAVNELVKTGVEPSAVRLTENRATFYFNETDWFQTNLLDGSYPAVDTVIAKAKGEDAPEVTDDVREAILKVLDFAEGEFTEVRFTDAGIFAGVAESAVEGLHPSKWNGALLKRTLDAGTHVNFPAWPDPAGWRGEGGITGVVCGLRA